MQWYKRKIAKEYNGDGFNKTKKRVPKRDQMIVEGRHPAIIDQDTFDSAQKLFTGQIPVKANKTIVNPLAGLIRCSKCGRAMVMHNKGRGNTKIRYMHQGSNVCKMKSSTADDVILAVIQLLEQSIEDFEMMVNQDNNKLIRDQKQLIIDTMEKELETLEAQRAGLFDKLERGIYTEDEFLQRKQTLTQRIDALQEEIYLEKKSVPEEVDHHEQIYKFSRVIECLQSPSVDARYKNDLLKGIIKNIDYTCIDFGHRQGGQVTLTITFK